MGRPSLPMYIDLIAQVNILEDTEKSVSMPGNAYVPRFAKRRSALNVTNRPIQCQIVRSFQNRHLQMK